MKREHKEIIKNFRALQSRQYFALAITLLLLVFLVFLYKRSDIFGEISHHTIFTVQIIVIAAFIVFSILNWRCPACRKYLGADINRDRCKKCGARLR